MLCSEACRVEVGEACGHLSLTVVLVHLGQRNVVSVQLLAGLMPPYWEVLAEGAAEVGAVGRRLLHDLGESLAGPLPVGTLYGQERGEGKRSRQTKNEVLGLGTQDGTHEWVSEGPAGCQLDGTLGRQLLQLVAVEFLHLDDLPLGKVVVLHTKISQLGSKS